MFSSQPGGHVDGFQLKPHLLCAAPAYDVKTVHAIVDIAIFQPTGDFTNGGGDPYILVE
jgi:hypothetical protein